MDGEEWVGFGLGMLFTIGLGLLLIFVVGGGWAILGGLMLGGAALLIAWVGIHALADWSETW